jgi:PKHD-type hydroxylase
MILNNYFWFFKSALSNKFCDNIIKTGLKKNTEIATTGKEAIKLKEKNKLSKKDIKELKKTRDSNVSFLNENWIFRELQSFFNIANRNSGWNFQYDFTENCQFTVYNKKQHYAWHADGFPHPYPQDHIYEGFRGKIRKLSLVCQLSDKKEYKGGNLEFDFRNTESGKPNIVKCIEFMPRGSVIVFPSFIYHRVTPVTNGTRYSLVAWNLGNPFI